MVERRRGMGWGGVGWGMAFLYTCIDGTGAYTYIARIGILHPDLLVSSNRSRSTSV